MIKQLTKEEFNQKFVGFNGSTDWIFEGSKPIIIDFFAKWCSPCKVIAPILDQINEKYGDKIEIYKIDTDLEIDIPTLFKIKGIPTLVFFPIGEKYFTKVGLIPKAGIEDIIKEYFKL